LQPQSNLKSSEVDLPKKSPEHLAGPGIASGSSQLRSAECSPDLRELPGRA
jgi:hypothetical protein